MKGDEAEVVAYDASTNIKDGKGVIKVGAGNEIIVEFTLKGSTPSGVSVDMFNHIYVTRDWWKLKEQLAFMGMVKEKKGEESSGS